MNSLIGLRRNLLGIIFPFIDLSEEARNWMLLHRASLAVIRQETYHRLITNAIRIPTDSVITKCKPIDIWRFATSELFLQFISEGGNKSEVILQIYDQL